MKIQYHCNVVCVGAPGLGHMRVWEQPYTFSHVKYANVVYVRIWAPNHPPATHPSTPRLINDVNITLKSRSLRMGPEGQGGKPTARPSQMPSSMQDQGGSSWDGKECGYGMRRIPDEGSSWGPRAGVWKSGRTSRMIPFPEDQWCRAAWRKKRRPPFNAKLLYGALEHDVIFYDALKHAFHA
eukprot:1146105-Pelagomonas_calceolata.AAC.3